MQFTLDGRLRRSKVHKERDTSEPTLDILFLDFDGVLVSDRHLRKLRDSTHQNRRDEFGHLFDPQCVKHLKTIIKQTSASIVISSTWREDGMDRLLSMWRYREMPGEIIGITPLLEGKKRGDEIDAWLSLHLESKIDYVILDDIFDFAPHQKQHSVLCKAEFGLQKPQVEEIISRWGKVIHPQRKPLTLKACPSPKPHPR